MLNNKKNILKIFLTSTFVFSLSGCGTDTDLLIGRLFSPYDVESYSKVSVPKPLTVQMPSANYNERPAGIKIDTIVIHHTAPFESLDKVGYYFQNINTRVSAHYTIGKDGTIIQSVDEKYRAWHAGVSSFLGKYDVNNYSIGIELLNNGDGKDPFTKYQYDALAKLTAYIVKKYDIQISRIVGHKDIALPLGRKVDPANNFDWIVYKSMIRKELKQPKNLFAQKEEPKDINTPITEIEKDIQDKQPEKRISAIEKLFTVPFETIKGIVEKLFLQEKNQEVKSKYFEFFNFYNKSFNSQEILKIAKETFQNENNLDNLRINSAEYIYSVDKENCFDDFLKTLENEKTSKTLKRALIKIISNFNDEKNKEKVKEYFSKQLSQTVDKDEKSALIQGISNFNDNSFNKTLLSYLENKEESNEVKIASIETLKLSYDIDVEKTFIKLISDEKVLPQIMEKITDIILMVGSQTGIEKLSQNNIFKRLSTKSKIALIDTIGELNLISYEEWLMIKVSDEKDFIIKNTVFGVLGRLQQDRSFNYLYDRLKNSSFSPEMNFTLLKTFVNYNYLEVITALLNILKTDETEQKVPLEIKMLILSTIKEKDMKVLFPYIKELYNEDMPDSLYKSMLKETIDSLKIVKQ